jgi:hypothetical protein
MSIFKLFRVCAVASLFPAIGACTGKTEYNFPQPVPGSDSKWAPSDQINNQGIFGDSGIFGSARRAEEQGGGGIGVNALLWRAALETISFMPIASADPFGGVILTDWFTPAETPNERFKLNLFIVGRELRADGVRVSAFRQRLDGANAWIDAPTDQQTAIGIENAILTRARQIRTAGR